MRSATLSRPDRSAPTSPRQEPDSGRWYRPEGLPPDTLLPVDAPPARLAAAEEALRAFDNAHWDLFAINASLPLGHGSNAAQVALLGLRLAAVSRCRVLLGEALLALRGLGAVGAEETLHVCDGLLALQQRDDLARRRALRYGRRPGEAGR